MFDRTQIRKLAEQHLKLSADYKGVFILGFDNTVFYMTRMFIRDFLNERESVINDFKVKNHKDWLNVDETKRINDDINKKWSIKVVHYPLDSETVDETTDRLIKRFEKESDNGKES